MLDDIRVSTCSNPNSTFPSSFEWEKVLTVRYNNVNAPKLITCALHPFENLIPTPDVDRGAMSFWLHLFCRWIKSALELIEIIVFDGSSTVWNVTAFFEKGFHYPTAEALCTSYIQVPLLELGICQALWQDQLTSNEGMTAA
jgi:hypothetical protein